MPENLAGLGVERAQHLRDVAPEHEVAGGREHRAVAGRPPFVDAANLALRMSIFASPANFSGSDPGRLPRAPLAFAAGHGARHVETLIVDIGK